MLVLRTVLCFLFLVIARATDVEVGIDGTATTNAQGSRSSNAAEVKLRNRFASTILSVYWDGGGPGREVFIGTVAPG